MNKLLTFICANGKWHKFTSFGLGGGAKLYKNFARKLLAVSLCAAIAQLGVPITICVAEATIVDSGICGNPDDNEGKNVTWTLETNGDEVEIDGVKYDAYTLTISGTGEMYNTTCYDPPWSGSSARVTKVIIAEGVTIIGGKAFSFGVNLSVLFVSSTVNSFADEAFDGCGMLTTICVPCTMSLQDLSDLFSQECDIDNRPLAKIKCYLPKYD